MQPTSTGNGLRRVLLLISLFLPLSFHPALAASVCSTSPESLSVQESDQIKALTDSAAACVRQGEGFCT
jgi:hypothetical protein